MSSVVVTRQIPNLKTEVRFLARLPKTQEDFMATFIGTIDRKRYTDIPGMEGPYLMRSGKVLYYDTEMGQYYDRDTDFYLTYDEYLEHDK